MISEMTRRFITSLFAGFFFFGLYSFYPQLFPSFLLVLYVYIMLQELPAFFSKNSALQRYPLNIIVIFYPTLSILSLWELHRLYYKIHPFIPLYPYLAGWLFDTGSYLVGSRIGKHQITTLSPKKTWEGVIGGVITVICFHLFLGGEQYTFSYILLFSFLIALLAFFGDLFESFLKRKAKIKHSGRILPGHGGILDRFDSVFFVGAAVLLLFMFQSHWIVILKTI